LLGQQQQLYRLLHSADFVDGAVDHAQMIRLRREVRALTSPNDRGKRAASRPIGKRGSVRRLWRARRGATAVEMAFLLPVFVLFLLGIEEFGRALWTQTALQFAVEAAARCAAVNPFQCTAPGGTTFDVPSYAASEAFGLSIPSSAFTYTANAICGVSSNTTGSGGALVQASYLFRAVIPQLVPVNVTLTAKSCHP
jgi:Flp pilus assembly protein TadG